MTATHWIEADTDDDGQAEDVVEAEGVLESVPTIAVGAEVTVMFQLADQGSTTWRDYARYAGRVATAIDVDGEPVYREQLPSSAPIPTLLLGVRPTASDAVGLYGVLVDARDASRGAYTAVRWEATLLVLGEYGDYGTIADVRDAHEV